MTTEKQTRRAAPTLMVFPFPVPGDHVRLAYRELHIAINGTEEEKKALGNHALLPRPWEPATCLDPELRHDLWEWLEDVVIWLNREYTWDVSGLIPAAAGVREDPLLHSDQKDPREFKALGGMRRHQGNPVLGWLIAVEIAEQGDLIEVEFDLAAVFLFDRIHIGQMEVFGANHQLFEVIQSALGLGAPFRRQCRQRWPLPGCRGRIRPLPTSRSR